MSNAVLGNGSFGSGLLSFGLFGSKDKTPSIPPPPAFTPDPTYTSQQDFLQPYSMGLLSGNNIPAYYQSIGQQNSPQFQAALGVSNAQIGTSAAEGAAMAGTGRGGQLPQTIAQQVGNNTATLTYQDFLDSNAGKEFLMGQGENISNSVLNGALTNQGQENSYNLNAYDAAVGTDKANIAYQQQSDQQLGQLLGTIIPAVTTIGGGIIGGPAGAAAGSTLGSALTGNTSSIASLFGSNASTGGQAGGVSSVGSINPDPNSLDNVDLMNYFGLSNGQVNNTL